MRKQHLEKLTITEKLEGKKELKYIQVVQVKLCCVVQERNNVKKKIMKEQKSHLSFVDYFYTLNEEVVIIYTIIFFKQYFLKYTFPF